jgi:hypothetical protein
MEDLFGRGFDSPGGAALGTGIRGYTIIPLSVWSWGGGRGTP